VTSLLGVSPAFLLSKWGEGFGPGEYARSLPMVARLGFGAFQLEVFREGQLEAWTPEGCRLVRETALELGLVPTQLVGHFYQDRLSSGGGLSRREGLEPVKRLVEILGRFPECRVLTLPVGPAGRDWDAPGAYHPERLRELLARLAAGLAAILEVVGRADRELALEILPFSLLGGTEGFLRLAEEVGSRSLGYNLDTGHLWACKEEPRVAIPRLAGRILGTHLGDNFGNDNLKLRPGAGSIPWEGVIRALWASGYRGSLDLEIRCGAEELVREYSAGLSYLREAAARAYCGSRGQES